MRAFIFLFVIGVGCLPSSAAERGGQTFVITAKPIFEQRDGSTTLVISGTNRSFKVGWGKPPFIELSTGFLDTNQLYMFTVGLTRSGRFEVFDTPELRKIQMDGRTIYDIDTREISISAKPRFELRQNGVGFLVVGDTGRLYRIGWPILPTNRLPAAILHTNRVYSFVLAERPFDDWTIPELRSVRLEGETLYDIEVCEVHKTKMELKEATMVSRHGVPAPGEPSYDEEQQLFPHRREFFHGWRPQPEGPKAEQIFVCHECKKAYDSWKENHK